MKKTMLLVLVMMLSLAAAAFAQAPGATFVASTESVTTVVKSGHTELTGDIFLTIAPGDVLAIATGTFTLQYSVGVTSPLDEIQVLTSGITAAINVAGSSGKDGLVVINVTGAAGVPVAGSYIRIHGVRVDAFASATNTVSVSITSTGNAVQNGQFTANVINGLKPGLLATEDSESVTINGLAPIDTACTDASPCAKIVLLEGFLNAFGVTAATDTTQTQSQLVRIQLSGPPPTGATIVFPATATNGLANGAKWVLADSTGKTLSAPQEIADDASGADLEVYYALASDNLPTLQEDFIVDGIKVLAADADVPIAAGTITFRATLAPDKAAFTSKGLVTDLPIPRYEVDWTAAQDLVVIKGNTTSLLVPLFMSKTVEVPQWGPGPAYYDTGLAIANTTSDPGKKNMGIDSAAIKQAGKINFYIFLQGEATPVTYTTGAASPGTGLDADGNLPAGSTYVVLASEILTAAGLDVTENFQGYMIVVTNFTNAHGIEYVGDFIHVMQTSAMHVIKPNRQDVPEGLDQ